MYTVSGQPETEKRGAEEQFNVTKSINFLQCRMIPDVAYGFQTQQIQPWCAQCQPLWYNHQAYPSSARYEERMQPHPCEKCDPKEVKDNKLSRSTVMRFVLKGSPAEAKNTNNYAIKRAEVTSQYVMKNLKAETGDYGSAMHAVVAAELVFHSVQPFQQQQPPAQQTTAGETLLFSSNWDVEEKRFYMHGDDLFFRNSPFKEIQGKVIRVEQALRKLVQTAENKEVGIEVGFKNFAFEIKL